MTTFDDHRTITQLVYTYALGIDTRNWKLYRSIFTNEINIDFRSYSGQAPGRMRADQWVARVQGLFPGLSATQHIMTNPIVTVDGTSATCTMYMSAEHLLDPEGPSFTLGGYYTDSFVRTATGWLMSGVTLTVLWRRGDEGIMALVAQRAAEVSR
jgi:hypothetical protein